MDASGTDLEIIVKFVLTISRSRTLEQAEAFVLDKAPRLRILTRFGIIHSLYVAAPGNIYTRWAQSELGQVYCNREPAGHTHIGNLTEPRASDEIKTYITRVGPARSHPHQYAGR